MRKVAFWLMTLVVIALIAIIIVAQNKHTSPKLLIKSWFSHSGQQMTASGTITTGTMQRTPITTGDSVALSGQSSLSEDDKTQVHNFLDSVVKTK